MDVIQKFRYSQKALSNQKREQESKILELIDDRDTYNEID